MGELFLIGKEHDIQRQMDRACAAQSPDMWPKEDVDLGKVQVAEKRVKEFKNGI